MSLKSRVAEEKARDAAQQPEWDRSTNASKTVKKTAEERVAAKIANEMLKDNSKLRGVHSNVSIKKIIENEAKRQLLADAMGDFKPPQVFNLKERGQINKQDPSNLPYLHKCPAV